MVENRLLLNDEKWERIAPLLPGKRTDRGRTAACNIVDLMVKRPVIVELKFDPIHEAQLLSYLRLSGCHVGLLINFNVRVLRNGMKRMVHQLPER